MSENETDAAVLEPPASQPVCEVGFDHHGHRLINLCNWDIYVNAIVLTEDIFETLDELPGIERLPDSDCASPSRGRSVKELEEGQEIEVVFGISFRITGTFLDLYTEKHMCADERRWNGIRMMLENGVELRLNVGSTQVL